LTEEQAQAEVETMIRRDPNTVEIVTYMRKIGRTWTKIQMCFQKHMMALAAREAGDR
jgi:hypothetical protein